MTPDRLDATLGTWLKDHLTKRRNTVRFLLPRAGETNLFHDRNLLVLARAVLLASEWKRTDSAYLPLWTRYQNDLRGILKKRFDRFAILASWNFQTPSACKFSVEAVKEEGAKIPEAIDTHVKENLFIPEDFEEFVLAAAEENQSVGKMLAELQEPRPNGAECIPWLGETQVKEKLIRPCAEGQIAINLRGMEYLQKREDESVDVALKRMRGKLGTGKYLDETYVLKPQNVPSTGGVKPTPPDGGGTTTGGGSGGSGGGTTTGGGDGGGSTTTGGDTSTGGGTTAGGGTTTTGGGGGGGGSIFGGGGSKVYTPLSADVPTSALNLLAKVNDDWSITVGTKVRSVAVAVDELTGAQLHALLKALPPGTYKLNLEREDEQ